MDWRAKVELFEQLRREYEFGVGTIAGVAQKLGVHRRMVRETCVLQSYAWGVEAQVDWYEAYADLAGERIKLQVFAMRSMASGAAFHCAYLHATQQHFWKRTSWRSLTSVACSGSFATTTSPQR